MNLRYSASRPTLGSKSLSDRRMKNRCTNAAPTVNGPFAAVDSASVSPLILFLVSINKQMDKNVSTYAATRSHRERMKRMASRRPSSSRSSGMPSVRDGVVSSIEGANSHCCSSCRRGRITRWCVAGVLFRQCGKRLLLTTKRCHLGGRAHFSTLLIVQFRASTLPPLRVTDAWGPQRHGHN